MNGKLRWPVSAAIFIMGLYGAAQAGELAGRVTDAGGEYPFEGARVRLVELGRQTVAERDGRYRFSGLPAGSYTLLVEYVGTDPFNTTALVTAQGTTELDVKLGGDVAQIDNILVIGQAAGQSAALSQQRSASSIKTIVSADAIGQFPDQNAAESLQRLPGLSIERDQGEGRFVVIRGIDSALSSTTINGIRVPGPEAGSRQVNLDVISSDLLEGLEVTKSFTPDMDGDTIGGNVELKSATALDRGNSFTLRAEGSYNEQTDQTSPKLGATLTRLFSAGGGDDNFGVAASVSWFERDFGSDNVETAGWPKIEGPDGDLPGLEEAEQRDYTITRERFSTALNFDYRASDHLDLFWRSLYSDFSDDELQLTNVFKFEDGEVVALDGSSASFEGATVEKLSEARKETQTILSTVVGAEQRFSDYVLNYTLGYSEAEEDNPAALGATFVGEGLDVGYRSGNGDTLRLFSDDEAYADPSNFALDEVVLENSLTQEEETTLAFDLRRDSSFGTAPGFIKFGTKARLRDKTGDLDAFVYEGFPEDFTLADFGGQNVDYPFGAWGPTASRGQVRDFFSANRDQFELDEDGSLADSSLEDYDLREDVLAAYIMASADIGKLRVVGGVRVENTDYDANGTQLLLDEETGEGELVVSPVSRDKSYTDVLPSVNLRYELNEKTLLRAAYSQSLARPGFEAAAPRQSVEITEDEDDEGNVIFERVAELGNPDLDPLTSQNFDLTVEFYPGGVSAMSAGVFYKRIRDFFVLADVAGTPGTFEDFDEAITTLNGDSADLLGLELAVTQQFSTLPSPFDGLLISANATFTDSEASLPQRGDKVSLPRQSDRLANLVLGYDKYGITLRLSGTYRDSYFDEVGDLDDPQTDRYVTDHLQLDLTGSYRINGNYDVYFNAVNLNDEPFYAYFERERFSSQYEEYGPTFELGVKASF